GKSRLHDGVALGRLAETFLSKVGMNAFVNSGSHIRSMRAQGEGVKHVGNLRSKADTHFVWTRASRSVSPAGTQAPPPLNSSPSLSSLICTRFASAPAGATSVPTFFPL